MLPIDIPTTMRRSVPGALADDPVVPERRRVAPAPDRHRAARSRRRDQIRRPATAPQSR